MKTQKVQNLFWSILKSLVINVYAKGLTSYVSKNLRSWVEYDGGSESSFITSSYLGLTHVSSNFKAIWSS